MPNRIIWSPQAENDFLNIAKGEGAFYSGVRSQLICLVANIKPLSYFCIEMHNLIRHNEKSIKQLCLDHNVKALFAFGSVTTNEFKDESDVDFLVSFKPMEIEDYADNYFNLVERFEDLLKRPVDLITENSLKNPYFIESINKTKSKIYEA